jgi:hypothetical protein
MLTDTLVAVRHFERALWRGLGRSPVNQGERKTSTGPSQAAAPEIRAESSQATP